MGAAEKLDTAHKDEEGWRSRVKRYDFARRMLIFWCLFIGIGALCGGLMMLIEPTGVSVGFDALLPYFEALPFAKALFSDFVFPGIALITVNGITNICAAALLLKKKRSGVILGGVFGITLMLWITIQFIIFPKNFMSTAYFVFGALQALTGYACYVFLKQSEYENDSEEYPSIGGNGRELVVYFSRLGRTERVAKRIANESGASLCRLETTEPTEGTLGFWWCGRFGMMKMGMPLKSMPDGLEDYDKVTLVSPIWVFDIAAPMREFVRLASGRIKRADIALVHFQRVPYRRVFERTEKALGLASSGRRSFVAPLGNIREIKLR